MTKAEKFIEGVVALAESLDGEPYESAEYACGDMISYYFDIAFEDGSSVNDVEIGEAVVAKIGQRQSSMWHSKEKREQ